MSSDTGQRSLHWRIRAATVAVGLLAGLVALASNSSAAPGECSTRDWPAFSLAFSTEKGAHRSGLIVWCNSSHWTLHTFGNAGTSGFPDHLEADDAASDVFAWFTPAFTPIEAVRQLVPRGKVKDTSPRNRLAETAFVAELDEGRFRMEFTEEGIPVTLIQPGDGSIQFWASAVERASRTMWSDEHLMNRPICDGPTRSDSPTAGKDLPCWMNGGYLWSGPCPVTLAEETAEFKTLGCRL